MTESHKCLQDSLSDVLKDLISMSADVVRKSDLYLKDVQELDVISVDNVTKNIAELLARITTNLTSFTNQYNTALAKFKENSPKKTFSVKNSPDKYGAASSDTDSEKTVRNFDISNVEDTEKNINLVKSLEQLEQQSKIKLHRTESVSFDFDDELIVENFKRDTKNELDSCVQQDNLELLDLLNKTLIRSKLEDDVEESLRILKADLSASSGEVSEISESENEEKETMDSESDASSLELKNLNINLKKVDQLDNVEIERLCDLHNINKKKVKSEIAKYRRKKYRKRIRENPMSSSSSSELSSDESVANLVDFPLANPRTDKDDLCDLADEFILKLCQENDIEISSDSEMEESQPVKKKLKILSDNQSGEKQPKKRGLWRNEVHLHNDSTSSASSASEDEVSSLLIDDDDDDDKIEEEEDSKAHLRVKIVQGECVVITDSDSDEVTIVDEASSSSKGRRNIRAIMGDDQLNVLTQQAKSEEELRILRITEHMKNIESVQSQRDEFVLDIDVITGAPLITVHNEFTKKLKPHQKDGVQFMWQTCYESVETLKKNSGTGCILAHCMGLGKTLQVITLIHTLFKHPVTNTKHVVITCPLSTVSNWKNEFKNNFKNLTIDFKLFYIIKGELPVKMNVVEQWRRIGGVLIMGYEAYQILTNEKIAERVSQTQHQQVFEALINPGPDLIVCDEGHQLKNDMTLRTKALMQVKTKRRIVLTGTPMQNNLKEYYYMVEFVKPHLLGTFSEYKNRFATPIKNGQFHDSVAEDIKLMKKRTHVLTKLLKKTIHRVEASVLQSYLPEIFDYSIFVKLSPKQIELYMAYVAAVKINNQELGKGFLQDVMILNYNNLHPFTLQKYYSTPKPKKKSKKKDVSNDNQQEVVETIDLVSDFWYKDLIPEDVATNIDLSIKMRLILDIINESIKVGDKVLLFAQYLVELNTMEHFLKLSGSWVQDVDYYRMDGSTPVEKRAELCRKFNTNSETKVFLLTHRVGGLGLNLTGANRVIIVGSNHNPSIDSQSMYRVYRFGQQKKCYIYRLLSLCTMEEKIYRRCVSKQHLSGTVVDQLHYIRRFTSNDLQMMYKIDFEMYETQRPIPVVPTDNVLATLIQKIVDIYKYHPHNALLELNTGEELSDAEKQLAWDEFNTMNTEARPGLPRIVDPPIPLNRMKHRLKNMLESNVVPNPIHLKQRGYIPFLPSIPHSSYSVRFVNHENGTAQRPARINSNNDPLNLTVPNSFRANDINPAPVSGEFNYALNKIV